MSAVNFFRPLPFMPKKDEAYILKGIKEITQDVNCFAYPELIYWAMPLTALQDYSDPENRPVINREILYKVVLNEDGALHRLREDGEKTAGPHLINQANKDGHISEDEKELYLTVWTKTMEELSPSNQDIRRRLNCKILDAYSDDCNRLTYRPFSI